MKTKTLLTVIAFMLMLSVFSQKPSLELTFTAIDSAAYVQLGSIKVMNRTQGGDTVLYWPDTVIMLDYQVGIPENNQEEGKLQVFQNYPNPVNDQTTISLYVPERDQVSMIITDMLGRVILKTDRVLEKGYHSFRFEPGSVNLFFFTAQWRGNSSSIKIHTASNSYGTNSLEYMGSEASSPQLKATKDIQSFLFNLGDELLYIGNTGTLQSGMLDTPETSATYAFQFATNIPCPGTPTVTYEEQIYNTVQIFSQCWLKENLNIGTMISGIQNQQNNDTIEKYCYDNDPANCDTYGGLYQWSEMVKYTTTQGVQGICPPDWHIPTDEEWKVLEGAVDSQYSIGNPEWDIYFYSHGFNAGLNLKSTYGWYEGGNGNDLFGFSGLPGGSHLIYYGQFNNIGKIGRWWTATEFDSNPAWYHDLHYGSSGVYRWGDSETNGKSVRCVRDY